MFGNTPGYPGAPQQSWQPTPYAPNFMNGMSSYTSQANTPSFMQVPSAKDFNSVIIQPGRPVLIMAQNDPYIAFKYADAMGAVTTNLYRLEPATPEEIKEQEPGYITRQEFQQSQQELLQTIQQLANSVNKATQTAGRTKKEAAE